MPKRPLRRGGRGRFEGEVRPASGPFFQKNPRVRKIRVRNSGARNGCANLMDAWKNAFFLQEKAMSIKFLVLGLSGLKIDTPHLQKVRADFFGGFFGGFCKVNLRKGLPHKRSTRGHNWRSAKAHKTFRPQNLRHFLFLFHSHSHSHSLQRCHAQDKRPKNLLPTSAQMRNFSNARTRRHHLSHPSFSSSRSQRTQSVPRAPAAKLLATPPRPPFNKADVPTSRNCSSKPTPTQGSFL